MNKFLNHLYNIFFLNSLIFLRTLFRSILCILWLLSMFIIFMFVKIFRIPVYKDIPRYFHKGFLSILNINISLIGNIRTEKPGLIVSNHASWLDISILSSLTNISFIAKSEVATWPFFGFLAKLQNTLFIERKIIKAGLQKQQIKKIIDNGKRLVLFPEGTSSDGNRVLNFKSSLLSIVDNKEDSNNYMIQSLTICYKKINGLPISRSQRPHIAWWGDMGLIGHLFNIIKLGRVDIIVIAHEAIENIEDRKVVSKLAWKQVSYGMGLALSGFPKSLKQDEPIFKLF